MSIGKRIISLRENKGWNQRELANRVGLNASVMNRIELEERPLKDNELINLAKVLDCSTDYLLGISDRKEPVHRESSISDIEQEEIEFQAFVNDPSLQKWYKELPKSEEEDLQKLRKMWEIIKNDVNN